MALWTDGVLLSKGGLGDEVGALRIHGVLWSKACSSHEDWPGPGPGSKRAGGKSLSHSQSWIAGWGVKSPSPSTELSFQKIRIPLPE